MENSRILHTVLTSTRIVGQVLYLTGKVFILPAKYYCKLCTKAYFYSWSRALWKWQSKYKIKPSVPLNPYWSRIPTEHTAMVICEENYNIGISYFISDAIWKILGLPGPGTVHKACVCCPPTPESSVYETKHIVHRYDNAKTFIHSLYANCFCARSILLLYLHFRRVLHCTSVSSRNWVVVSVSVLVAAHPNFHYNQLRRGFYPLWDK